MTREHVSLADVLAGQVTCSSPATSRRDSPRLQPRRSRSRHRAACRGTRARPSWRGCGEAPRVEGARWTALAGQPSAAGGAARRGGSPRPSAAEKGGRRVLLGAPVRLGRPANGVIPPFFNRAVRGWGVKDMRRPPFRAAGTITMNCDTPPAKEPRGRLRAAPGPIGTGLTSPPSRRPPRRRPGPAGATLTRRGADAPVPAAVAAASDSPSRTRRGAGARRGRRR